MVFHIEIMLAKEYAPETILVRIVGTEKDSVENRTRCSADIFPSSGVEYSKPMLGLASIYEYFDSNSFTVTPETGYFQLETGMQSYTKDFEITIECLAPDNVSTLSKSINNSSQTACIVQKRGRLWIC
jgi:hypothetical protein